jgi:putative oxidoreductase
MQVKNILGWVLRIAAAVILLQTLYFKFTGQPESVALFSKLHAEPFGRIGSGIVELIASILLLLPATVFIGALIGVGVMSGAIAAHLFVIGIESQGDGGYLFTLAIIVFVCCISLLVLYKQQGLHYYSKFTKKKMLA